MKKWRMETATLASGWALKNDTIVRIRLFYEQCQMFKALCPFLGLQPRLPFSNSRDRLPLRPCATMFTYYFVKRILQQENG